MRNLRMHCWTAALALAASPLCWAATPASGELNDEAPALEWAGSGPYVFTNLTPLAEPVCEPSIPQVCDQFALTVNLSDGFREDPENARESVKIGITFDQNTGEEDYDLYLYDSAGALVSDSAGGGFETIAVPLKSLKNGTYTVTVIPFLPLATNYAGFGVVGKPKAGAGSGFTIAPQVGAAPLTTTLDARLLTADVASGGYVFDFGDGSAPVVDEDGLVQHSYERNGQYLARVRVADSTRSAATAAQPVFVGEIASKSGKSGLGGALGPATLLALLGVALRRARRSRI